jgi:hypothetical protein
MHDEEYWLPVDFADVGRPVGVFQVCKYPVGPENVRLKVPDRWPYLHTLIFVHLGDLVVVRLVQQNSDLVAFADEVFGHVVDVIFPTAVVNGGIEVDGE